MLRWAADQGWVAWSHISWNYRKTRFRLRGARGRAPCQSASDTGRALQTRCEACYICHDPAQFKRVCPLLDLSDLNQPLCSVDAADVRPFWGRALRYYGTILGSCYFAAVLVAFVGFRSLGYRVSPLAVAWPGRWSDVDLARADYFYAQGLKAYAGHDVKLSILALTEAYDLAPGRNEEAAFVLAQLSQLNWPLFSDQIYARLVAGNTPSSPRAVEAWCRSLVARGDMAGLARLSEARLLANDPNGPIWINALVFAGRLDHDFGGIQRLVSGSDPLTPDARFVLGLAMRGHQENPEGELNDLRQAITTATTSFQRFYVLERFIALGRSNEALGWLDKLGAKMAARERIDVLLDASAAAGWTGLRQREVAHILVDPLNEASANLLAAQLIRYPEPELTAMVFAAWEERPLPFTPVNYPAYNALLCLAGTAGDDNHLQRMGDALERISGARFNTLEIIRDFFNDRKSTRPISQYLPALEPMSLEVSYALLTRYPSATGPRHLTPAQ